jgi:hypothetical protein
MERKCHPHVAKKKKLKTLEVTTSLFVLRGPHRQVRYLCGPGRLQGGSSSLQYNHGQHTQHPSEASVRGASGPRNSLHSAHQPTSNPGQGLLPTTFGWWRWQPCDG